MWQPSQEGLNRSLLLARDPILLYASVPLYVSELDDHGLSALDCKVCVPWLAFRKFTGVT